MRAKITRRARTVTEGLPMGDPYCAANRPLWVENCWPMEIGQKPESCLKPHVVVFGAVASGVQRYWAGRGAVCRSHHSRCRAAMP